MKVLKPEATGGIITLPLEKIEPQLARELNDGPTLKMTKEDETVTLSVAELNALIFAAKVEGAADASTYVQSYDETPSVRELLERIEAQKS